MGFSDVTRCATGLCAAAALLVGCAGPQGQGGFFIAAPGASISTHATLADGRSWMLPEAESQDLLYIGNIANSGSGTGTVTVYTYPQGKLVGTLKGFTRANGLCVDESGDIFVANFGGEDVIEYAHGGTKAIATLKYKGTPYGCAIDPTTGNLAVTIWCNGPIGSCYSEGTVLIYRQAKGKPEVLKDPTADASMSYCAYDKAGNLFVDSYGELYHIAFAELPKRSKTFKTITLQLPKRAEAAGGLQWVRNYLAVGFADGNVVGEYSIKGDSATRAHVTLLEGIQRGFGTNQFWVGGSTLVAPIIPTPKHPNGIVEFFSYPQGGKPFKTFTTSLDVPWAAMVSPAKTGHELVR